MKTKTNFILILLLISTYCMAQSPSPSLLEAARKGNVQEIRKLLRAGADINKADRLGNTPLIKAAFEGHLAAVQELLRSGAAINKAANSGNTPLMWAAFKGHLAVVQELLQSGADKNKADQSGNTPLTEAAVEGHLAVVQELLQSGADINKADKYGNTPLMWAASKGHVAVVQELLRAGADIHKAHQSGYTALNQAATPKIKELILEAQKKRAQIAQLKPAVFQQIETIGTTQQEIVNLKQNHQRALNENRKAEAQKIQQQLIAQERNLKFQLDQFKKLMTQVTMNITDADDNTPLHKAVQTNNLKLVEWIFQFQPDLAKRKNNAGQTPVELAAGRPQILQLFVRAKQ